MTDYYSNVNNGRHGNQPTQVLAPNVFGTAGTNASNSPTVATYVGRPAIVANANFFDAAAPTPANHHWQNMVEHTKGQATQGQATVPQATVHR